MEKYSKEQLIKAMEKYQSNAINNHEGFVPYEDTHESAVASVDYLLSLVEPE